MTTNEQQRAREIVLDIFPELMLDVGFSNMTVQHILQRANIGRTTFYAHFTNKEDVLKNSVGRLRDWLIDSVKRNEIPQATNTRFAFTLYFFMHIGSHHRIYDHLIGRDDSFVVERYLLRMLRELVSKELSEITHTVAPSLKLELITQHIVGAIWTTGIWWLERKQLSAEEMNESFQAMVANGLEMSLRNL